MPVETVHVQSLIEFGSGLEYVIFLGYSEERIKVCTESIISDVADVIFRSFNVLNVETALL